MIHRHLLFDEAPTGRRATELTGRDAERDLLDQVLAAVRSGESRVLVVHGEPGIGKSSLLEYLAVQASGCLVVRVGGVQSEMELAYAGLHQLCAPLFDRLERLPAPQRNALHVAFGFSAGAAPDRFLVGQAVLGLLSEAAGQRPLVCLVDDQQWLDRTSGEVLTFVARRLGAEPVALIFAARTVEGDLATLPRLSIAPLAEAHAQALLDGILPGPIDARVRDQILAEARGNPLALLELPRALPPAQLAGGFGLPGALLPGGVEDTFVPRITALPDQARRLLLVAAADPTGNAALVWRAALLDIGTVATVPIVEAGLADFTTRIRFRHPLVRSAAYRSASTTERLQAHRALAEVTDVRLDPDRRAWHLAQAAAGPDENVAAELEQSAGRARARGGLAAAAAFLHRAAVLTLDPVQRVDRALAAASTEIQAGDFAVAQDLVAMAEAEPLSDLQRVRADLIRAQLAFVTNRGSDAPLLMLQAARRLEVIDPQAARVAYLDALTAAIFTDRLATSGGGIADVARAARTTRMSSQSSTFDVLLDGLAIAHTDGYAAGAPILRETLDRFGSEMPGEEDLPRLGWFVGTVRGLGDAARWEVLSARYVQIARETGAVGELLFALTARAFYLFHVGKLSEAAPIVDEVEALKEATASRLAPYAVLGLAAYRGDEARTIALIDATITDVTQRGEGLGITIANWAGALLHNGLGRYPDSLAAAQTATAYRGDLGSWVNGLIELVEAAVRVGARDVATDAHRHLADAMTASGTPWALGLRARSQALISDGPTAERHYREAIAHLQPTRLRVDLARTHLLYGEWLRRERRHTDARVHLRTSRDIFDTIGMNAFADRAARELQAAGGTTHRHSSSTAMAELTSQEAQIAIMARDGLSNPDIAARMFLSRRTVQYHLRKVFIKLEITSRSQLKHVLPQSPF